MKVAILSGSVYGAAEDVARVAQQVLHQMTAERRCAILAAAPIEKAHQWVQNTGYPEDSVGWLMEPPVAVFRPSMTVRETIEALRKNPNVQVVEAVVARRRRPAPRVPAAARTA